MTTRIASYCRTAFCSKGHRLLSFNFLAGSGGQSQRHFASNSSLSDILASVKNGTMDLNEAEQIIHSITASSKSASSASSSTAKPEDTLQYFANLDHTRSFRTSFPEVVFAETKTPQQVAMILDDMARHVNEVIQEGSADVTLPGSTAILATRVSLEQNREISSIGLRHGTMTYFETARIISVKANSLSNQQSPSKNQQQSTNATSSSRSHVKGRVVVATAGTTDLPVAEEAAIVLEAAGCTVDRIFDVGVAGLHRIVGALPRLRDDQVGAIIVCAGMDGALPSVVGGLVSVPVFAVPTSIGYGVSLGGIAAMLTMLNSCAPGVSVVNIDNGFGAAACAFKVIKGNST